MTRPYDWLARYYDPLFAAHRGPMDEAREELLGRILTDVESACDLACGAGVRRGDDGSGTGAAGDQAVRGGPVAGDVPAGAGEGAEGGVAVRVSPADMRTFRLPEVVDLITCEYDALNHVPRKEDLRLVTMAVARALRPGGWFFFDVNNRLGFRSYWRWMMWAEQPGVVLVMRNGEDHMHDRAWCDVEWFVQEGRL